MYILKRSWYYITRKKGKSVTIGIILFIVATLVLIGLLINSAANKTFKVAKQKLASNVIYKSDTSSYVEEQMKSNESELGMPREFSLPENFNSLTTKEVLTIAENSKYVKSYSYSASYTANPVDFSEYDTSSSTNETNDEELPNNNMPNMASLTITGVQEESEVINSTNVLSSGTFFTEEQINEGQNVVIIEKTLADLNSLAIGDTIEVEQVTMKRGRDSEDSDTESVTVTYTVVGIYESNESTEISDNNFSMALNNVENKLYVPSLSILKMQEIGLSDEEIELLKENGYNIEQAVFILNDPDDYDKFIEEVNNMEDVDLTYRSLSIDTDAYDKMVGNIKSIASTSKILVTVVVVAGVAIIMLLSMLTIKDRKYEIGVLLSLGESKLKVMFQLVFEVLIIGLISFTLATITTNFFAQKLTNYLLTNESTSTQTIDMNKISTDMGGNMQSKNNSNNQFDFKSFNNSRPDTSNMDVETIEDLTVSLSVESILALYGIGFLIIIVGNVLQTIFVIRLNPKEIMLDR